MTLTIEERLKHLRDSSTVLEDKYELVLICEDEKAHEVYFSKIPSWKNKTRLLHQVACTRQIATIEKPFTNHPSVIFFGRHFLLADDFYRAVLIKLNALKYDSTKVKIELFEIV